MARPLQPGSAYRDLAQPRTPAISAQRALDRFHAHDTRTVESNQKRKQLAKNPATDPTLNPLARRPPTTVPRVGEWAVGSSSTAGSMAPPPSRPASAMPPGYQPGVRVFPERARVAGSAAAVPTRVARARAATVSLGGLAEPSNAFRSRAAAAEAASRAAPAAAPAAAAANLSASASLSQARRRHRHRPGDPAPAATCCPAAGPSLAPAC